MAGSLKVRAVTVAGVFSPNCWMEMCSEPGSWDLRGRLTSMRSGRLAGFQTAGAKVPGVASVVMEAMQAVPVEESRT